MFYKFNTETNEWYFGNEVHFPDGTKLTADNKETKDGWEWHDEPPQEYLETHNTQINEMDS
jgi:hypothetical protein